MAVGAEYAAFVADQLADLGPVAVRPMFGGAGVYCAGVMFALIADEVLYFKTDEENRADFEAEGMAPFTYRGKRRPVRMSYFEVPEHVLEDREMLTAWAEKALAAARRAKG